MSDPWTMVLEVLPALAKIIVRKVKEKRLSVVEKGLLVDAARDGEFHKLSVNELPDWVRAGTRDFCSIDDPAFAAKYLDAFRSLCERGYITHDVGTLYRLTHVGFKKARQLAARARSKSVS